jgi:phosphoribosyl-dephospho-CoA transferase
VRKHSIRVTAPLRPHDLLWVDAAAALHAAEAWPAWATSAWLAVAPAVVRRALPRMDRDVPVGLRGATRSERCAAHVRADRIMRRVTPEELAEGVGAHPAIRQSPLPCLRMLARLAPVLDDMPLRWGVTGSVGFTLASGFDVLRADSDLDLLLRAPSRTAAGALRAVAALTVDTETRVDIQVETLQGAFALREWLRTGGPVLLKTAHGPVLCVDPWGDAGPALASPA